MTTPAGAPSLRTLAQRAKHQVFLARKKARIHTGRAADLGSRWYDQVRPYRYVKGRYPLSFLDYEDPVPPATLEPAPQVLWCFWTGDNPLTPNRQAGLDILRASSPALELRFITPATLDQVEVDGFPLHPAYEHLSFVHRSDYLRAYVGHHHGGAYSDLKRSRCDWSPLLARLNADPRAWALGFPEMGRDFCASMPGDLGRDIRLHYRQVIGTSAFAMRPRTPLTVSWLGEVHRRLDYYLPLLRVTPGNALGDNEGYPIFWTDLASMVLQPLCLKYTDHILRDPAAEPPMVDHR